MGGDGQALGNKHSLLNKSKQYSLEVDSENIERVSEAEKRRDRWKICSISLEPLESPAVFDLGGEIYSKISVVDYLINRKRSEGEDKAIDIKKLSEVREITNKLINGAFKCPVTEYLTSSGVHSFAGFWGCGHVVACEALATIKCDSGSTDSLPEAECPICGLSSMKVLLVLPPQKQKEQRARLCPYLRSLRKRSRGSS